MDVLALADEQEFTFIGSGGPAGSDRWQEWMERKKAG